MSLEKLEAADLAHRRGAELRPHVYERQYLDLLWDLLVDGHDRPDRTGVGRRSIFAPATIRVPLSQGFPLLTTKRLYTRAIVAELVMFLRGITDANWLRAQGVTIWDEWARPDGDLGPVYGRQWRAWACPDGRLVDQLAHVVEQIRTDPFSARHIVSAWNVADLEAMALPPCHVMFQFFVGPERMTPRGLSRTLDCQVYQRSADVFLGLPFNVASYALLTHLVAAATGLQPGFLHHVVGDAHLYANHIPQAQLQRVRPPRDLPELRLPEGFGAGRFDDLLRLEPEDVRFFGYDPHPAIKAPVAA